MVENKMYYMHHMLVVDRRFPFDRDGFVSKVEMVVSADRAQGQKLWVKQLVNFCHFIW